MRVIIILLLYVGVISCSSTLPTYQTKISGNAIQVPVSGFETSGINIVTDSNAPYDILLVKESQLAFHAIYMKCSYDEKRLGLGQPGIVCPVCNSVFDYDGIVKTGPADTRLLQFPTELNPDQTLVRIDISILKR